MKPRAVLLLSVLAAVAAAGVLLRLFLGPGPDPASGQGTAAAAELPGPAVPTAPGEPEVRGKALAGAPPVDEPESAAPQPAAAPRTALEAEAPLEGRVQDWDTGAGVPGFEVELLRIRSVVGRAVSDGEGAFRLARPEGSSVRLQIVQREGWVLDDDRFRLSRDQLAGEEPIVVRARRVATAPLAGRLVDLETGEPVPWFHLEIVGRADKRERLVTDAGGRFAGEVSFEAGKLVIRTEDAPGGDIPFGGHEKLFHEHDGSGEEVELRLALGPTFRLELEKPEGFALADLQGHLVESYAADHLDEWRRNNGTPLRSEGGATWIRFPADAVRFLGERPGWHLMVNHRERLWRGSAPVPSLKGVQPEPVRIALEPCGALEGALTGTDGAPAGEVHLHLHRPGTETAVWNQAAADGSYAFDYVPAGTWDLSLSSPRHLERVVQVEVAAGETTRRDVQLESVPVAGPVRGRLLSQVGEMPRDVYLMLRSRSDPQRYFHIEPQAVSEDLGQVVATFAFEDVPPGDYVLKIDSFDDMEWSPEEVEVTPPAYDVEFLRLDDVALVDLGFRVYDAVTGEEIPRFSLRTRRFSGMFGEEALSGSWPLPRSPEGRALEWRIEAPGYAPAYGDLSAFDRAGEGGPRPRRFAEVRLRPGWGARFEVVSGAEGLEGARILLDGTLAGLTDAEGRLDVRRSSRPGRVEVQLEGYAAWGGAVNPETGELTGEPWLEHTVYMGPVD